MSPPLLLLILLRSIGSSSGFINPGVGVGFPTGFQLPKLGKIVIELSVLQHETLIVLSTGHGSYHPSVSKAGIDRIISFHPYSLGAAAI